MFLHLDWALLLAATSLSIIGLLSIYSIGISRDVPDLFQFQKQVLACVIGMVIVFGFAFFDYRQLRAFVLPLYGVGAALLVAVLIFGTTIHGTRGWFVIGRLSFQPVEIAKILLALFLASYLSRNAHKRLGWIPFFGSIAATGGYVGLVLLQPDLGSAAVMFIMWLVTVLFTGLPRRAGLLMLLGAVIVLPLLWSYGLKPYQRTRLVSFLDPAADPLGAGYNVAQARIAIGSGGWFGKGLGEGSQSRLRFLPESSTDFAFSVIGEELGYVGVMVVLALFLLLSIRMVRIAGTAPDAFAQLLLVALLSIILFHLLENAGMNLGMMPVTGIPLPFISAAPSSVIAVFVMIALAGSIAVQRQPAAFR